MQSTVIIPVLQDPAILRLFLESLSQTLEPSTQVIFINDGSGQVTQELLEEHLILLKAEDHEITVDIVPHVNPKGCASSINDALRMAAGNVIYTLDSDLILSPGWQSTMRQTLIRDESIGMTGGVLLYPQTGGIQHCGVAFTDSTARHLHLNAEPRVLLDSPYEVQLVVFALFAMKREVFDRVGLLDETFFNGYEDFDYQMRARALGYRTFVDPQVKAYHWERSNGIHRSSGQKSNLAKFWKTWAASLEDDLWPHLLGQVELALAGGDAETPISGVDLAEARGDANAFWQRLSERLNSPEIPIHDYSHEVNSVDPVLLHPILPEALLTTPHRLIILLDNFTRLLDNHLWLDRRLQVRADDLVVDLYGNAMPLARLRSACWPGRKIR
jgi:O-antigen biosynthesis protein